MTNVNVRTCQFKTWCKGDKSNIENSTDHFCEDTRQNALAALTNLGHVTPFLVLGPSFDDTMGEVIFDACTKYEVSIFNCSEDIKWVQIFETPSRDLSHAHLWVIFSSRKKGLHAMYYHMKFGVRRFSFQKLGRGP